MSLRHEIQVRHKQERSRDSLKLHLEESKLQQKLKHLTIEHTSTLKMLAVEKDKFRAKLERKGFPFTRSLTSLTGSVSFHRSKSDIFKDQPHPLKERRFSQCLQVKTPSLDSLGDSSSIISSKISLIVGDSTVNTPPGPSSPLAQQLLSGEQQKPYQRASMSIDNIAIPPVNLVRERAYTYGGQTTIRYVPNLPELRE